MPNKLTKHWTEESTSAFAFELAAGFVRFVERGLDHLSQAEIAKRLGVSEGSVSQMLNKPGNFTLKRIVEYARRALRVKVTIIAYDDGDSENVNGPIQPEVFVECWNRCGKPRNFAEVSEHPAPTYLTYRDFRVRSYKIEAKAGTDYSQKQNYGLLDRVTTVGTPGLFGSVPHA
jgi:transcriptional regulator with XRE-family HTH domain